MHETSPFRSVIALCAALLPAFASGIGLQVTAVVGEVAPIELQITVAGKPVCTLQQSADAKDMTAPSCRTDLPADAKSLTVQGSYAWIDTDTKKRHSLKGQQDFKVLDFAPAGGSLIAADKSYGARIAAFVAATHRFAHSQVPDYDDVMLTSGKPVDQAAIDAAQKRLGYTLPADFVSMLRTTGALVIGDHSVMQAAEIANAYTQMHAVWGTPEDAMQSEYSESFRAVLKTSTLLFTEVGDGYGGLLYRPGRIKACGDAGGYYWTSQEGGTELLKNADGRCMDFADAFRWVLNHFVIDEIANAINEESSTPVLLIDSSTGTQRVQLTVDTGDTFHIVLNVPWSGD